MVSLNVELLLAKMDCFSLFWLSEVTCLVFKVNDCDDNLFIDLTGLFDNDQVYLAYDFITALSKGICKKKFLFYV